MNPATAALVKKWNLNYAHKTRIVDAESHRPREDLEDELEPNRILDLLPGACAEELLHSGFRLQYDNGARISCYDRRLNLAVLKSTHDLLLLLGYGIWHNFNTEKKTLVSGADIAAASAIHFDYAILVGAWSMEQLQQSSALNVKENSTLEHFAINFNQLVLRQPLYTLPESSSAIDDFLRFYEQYGIADPEFMESYRMLAGENPILRVESQKMSKGEEITLDLAERIERLKLPIHLSTALIS
ncbi:hypothetical protein HYX14_00300 [Candidatus Woesearchaeota archaeon]|nr:hypothetical protein [Candidatus Woesearchaeota archaeon]